MTQDITVRIGLEGAAQVQTGLQGVGRSAETVGQALGRLGPASQALANNMGMVGISAGQATNAMRQLPAQITDIVTGLASGQAPLTVLIQQGGQLRDSFGSVGNVLRGLASVANPVALALGAVAATVGAVALAYKQGSAEADAYRRALVLTGNAAGATVSQLQQAAASVGGMVGTQGKAADVIAQLAASGRVAAADLGKLAEAAIRLEREGGPAVEKTVQAFVDLAASPADAARKLNETTNFLTLGLYRQIKALEDQGKTTQAAALAQNAYAAASSTRAKELEGSLGSLERAWRDVAEGAKAAWDAMLGIGRKETAVSLYEKVASEIARIRDAGGGLLPRDPAPGTASEMRLRQLEQMRDGLARLAYEESKLGIAQAASARQNREAIAAEAERLAALKKAAEEWQRLIEKGRDLVQGNDLEKAGFSPGFLKDMQALQAYAKAAGLSTAQLQSAIGDLIEKQPFAERAAKLEAEAHKAVVEAMGKEMEARQKHLDALTKDIEAQDKSNEKLGDELVRLRDGEAALEARIELRQRELVATLELQAVQALLERGDAAEYERIRQRASALETEIELRRQISGAKAANDARDAAAKDAEAAARAWERTADNIRESLTDAFRRAFESGEDFGTAMAKVIENELKARIATALAGLLAEGVMSLAGIDGGSGGGNKATASSVIGGANLATNVARLYGAGGSGTGSLLASANYANVYGGTAYGTAYGSQQSAMLASQEAGMVNASTASYASWAGYAALAIMAAIQGSADYSRGFRREQSRDSGTALGDASYRTADLFSRLGVSDRIADLISGATLTARLFGRAAPQVVGQGVLGTFGGGGQAYSVGYADIQERGGVFRGDKNYTAYSNLPGDRAMFGLRELPQEISRFLSDASASMYAEAKRFGDVLGLPAEQLATVASDFRIALTDDVEANKQAIADAIGAYGDALVQSWSAAVAPLAQYGETVAQTIQRVGGALLGVNEVLQTIGANALAASIDGGRAALALQNIFGGLQGLQQAAGSFATNYLTDAERTQAGLAAVGRVLEQMGVQTPRTREQFADLVRAQDLTTESGRSAMAGLLGVADAFAQLTPATAELQAAIERVLPKFGATGDSAAYDRIATNLRGAGFDLNAGQLLAASKAQVYEYARAVVESADVTMAAKLAIVDAAGALADLKDAAAEAAQAAAEAAQAAPDAAAALAARVADGLAAVIGDFASPDEVARVRAGRIAATLAGGGITVGAQQIIGSTREDIVALWRSVGDEGRAAILEAYDAWQELQRGIQDARIADILRGVAGSVDELSQAYAQIVPQSETLVQQWQRAGQEMDQLARALDDIAGTGAPTALQQLQASVAQRDGLQRIIGSNADRAFQLRAGAGDASALQLLRTREADLWRQYAGTANPELAAAITDTTLQRIDLEGRLQQQAAAATIDALQQQLDTAQRLRDIAAQVGDYITSLKAGNLSALGYTGRLAAGQQLLDRAIATGGDVTGAASALLSGGQQAFGGATAAYAGLFNRVVGQLEGVAAGGPGFAADVSAAQAQIAHLQSISDTSMQQAQALDTLNATFGADLAGVSASIQTQTAALTEQLSELRAMKTTLEAQITQAAEAYRRLVQAQERTADAVESIDERAELEAAAP